MLRLNVGCGTVRRPGEVGIDLFKTAAVDVVADLLELPYAGGEAEQVRLDHVIEHLPVRVVLRALLEAYRVLASGGKLIVGVPDIQNVCRQYLDCQDRCEKSWVLRSLYGSQVHEGEFHRSGWDADTLVDLLRAVRFVDIEVGQEERPEGPGLLAVARKP